MNIDFNALLSFVVITTFTPGPNNISSASMGVLFGYKATWRYIFGIGVGFFLLMLLCGLISTTLLQILPDFENILRVIGAIYILWLAFHTLKASYAFNEDEQPLMGFSKGFMLQMLNPKVIVYGLTVYSAFLGGIVSKPLFLITSASFLAFVGFVAPSTWALFGSAIHTYLDRPRVKQLLNTALSLLLVGTAIELSGLLN
jgi:cysteine/O-acetylserine efflux protein